MAFYKKAQMGSLPKPLFIFAVKEKEGLGEAS